jgi:hypothetical protein
MKRNKISFFLSSAALLGAVSVAVQATETVTVVALAVAPTIDGNVSDWGNNWQRMHVKPAKEKDRKNRTGALDLELQVGVADGHIYIAARWPDKKADLVYKNWVWKKNKYKRDKKRDDMFAIRFDMAGDFNSCMIADANYEVDVWLWSAARSNQAGYASDMWHQISLNPIENAAEYDTPSGNKVYIKKQADAGIPGFKNTKIKRKKFQGDIVAGVEISGGQTGSVADVTAKGLWQDGYWTLELKRKLNTGQSDDVAFAANKQVKGQVAIFNKGYAEHKSVSSELLFDFSGI